MRQRIDTVFCLDGRTRMPARKPVSGHGSSFIGRGTAFSAKSRRLKWTIIVIWGEGRDEPCIILTNLKPSETGASCHQMRFWIETGFKALKSVGWQWQKARRTAPALVERHWLVLSVATLLTLAFGSRVEDANALKRDPKPTPVSPLWERASARARRALARLCGRDARAPNGRRRTASANLWIPAFAGMTGEGAGMTGLESANDGFRKRERRV